MFQKKMIKIFDDISSKFQYRTDVVKCMANIISFGSGLIEPDQKHLITITDMQEPTDMSAVMRLLGLFKYLGHFISNLSRIELRIYVN